MTATSSSSGAESAAARRRSVDELDAAIRRLTREINVASYELLLLVREFDDRLGWAQWSFRNCSEWLAWRCGISLSAAREKVRTAQALRALPRISEAFGAGRLSYSKVRALTRAASAHDEDLLLAYALDATAAQVEQRCRELRHGRPESVHVARRAWERRSLTVWRHPEKGTLTIHAEIPIEAGEIVSRALDRAVAAGEAAAGPEFPEASWQSQQADALVAVARAYLECGAAAPESAAAAAESPSAADHRQIVVRVDESALRGGAGRSDLPIETVKRLACDASVVTLVENACGEPLDVGRRQRTVPAAIRRALWSRDEGCSFPGCGSTRFIDAHHIRHWSEGGATSLENTTLLCSHHHRLVHEGEFRIERDERGGICFRRADGRVIPRCGYCTEDAEPDPVFLGGTSAEAWLAAVSAGRKPSAEVREPRASYALGTRCPGGP